MKYALLMILTILLTFGDLWVHHLCSSQVLSGKELPVNAGESGDAGSNPGLERSPGVRNGNPFQYSCLEKSMNRGA